MLTTVGVAKVIIISYFIHVGVKVFAIKNIGIDMRFELYLKKKQQQSFVKS